ncbi:aminodeoxychorismate/anthranilate synthase component II [Thermocatellispora tengchongensis]|uniref:aminodeoxychorismate/anthranilate synthase component II n=1 Tax=Thermocatellispora tengchongensis TaxID=1073253 RepID=UPI0031E871D9
MDMSVTVRRYGEAVSFDGYDLVVLGPGPGDPRDARHPRIAYLRAAVDALLAERRPFLAVCLSHQVLCVRLGFRMRRKDVPNQGLQKEIDLFGVRERVGFYNTFAARSELDGAEIGGVGAVRICRDPATGEVHALHGPWFSSLQFHAESVLTQNGPGDVLLRGAAVLPREAGRGGRGRPRGIRHERRLTAAGNKAGRTIRHSSESSSSSIFNGTLRHAK